MSFEQAFRMAAQHFQNILSKRLAAALGLAALLALSACTTVEQPEPQPEPPPPAQKGVTFELASFDALPAIEPGSWSAALGAFRQSCQAIRTDAVWTALCAGAAASDAGEAAAEAFFKTHFTPWRIEAPKGSERTHTGLMTGYYEPLLQGSRVKRAPYLYPIHGVPSDLLIIDLGELYPDLRGRRLRGKLDGRRVVPYDTRGTIDARGSALDSLAIAWVNDPVDAFFLHIQGSGRIRLPDGSFMRVGFADQNGWRYRSIASWISKEDGIPLSELSMQGIRAWAKNHPEKVKEALAQNPSYIFFEERTGDPALGPAGAQGVPLTPLASVAADPAFWKLGTPFIVSAVQERPKLAFARPVIAQDTGGAIKGAIRFDYFWGFGDKAGAAAGRQKSTVSAWMLVPLGLEPRNMLPAGEHPPR